MTSAAVDRFSVKQPMKSWYVQPVTIEVEMGPALRRGLVVRWDGTDQSVNPKPRQKRKLAEARNVYLLTFNTVPVLRNAISVGQHLQRRSAAGVVLIRLRSELLQQ